MKNHGKLSVIFCILILSAGLFARRWYDPQLARWTTPDPADQFHSPYTYGPNDPINGIDPDGLEWYVNNIGELVDYYTFFPEDNSVYLIDSDLNLTLLGNLDGELDVNFIFTNLYTNNISLANDLWNPIKFYNLVKTGGDWDYKSNMNTIYGYARKYKTTILFEGEKFTRGDEIGNIHYGIVGKAFAGGIGIPEYQLLFQAGFAQIRDGNSRQKWIKYTPLTKAPFKELGNYGYHRVMLPPYGDDPVDQIFIQVGFGLYNNLLKSR